MDKPKRMSEYILEDFKRGGQHEKVFKGIMLFWCCVVVVLLVFAGRYRLMPLEFQVVNSRYIEDAGIEYSFVNALYQIDVEVKGRITEESLDQFTESARAEYRDEFKDSYYMIIYFYDKYQIDQETGKPDRKPLAERKIYL